MDNTSIFYQMIQNSTDFEAAHVPQCNILCFRFHPKERGLSLENLSKLQQKIRNQFLREGEGYITGTWIDGQYWLRVTIINPLTTAKEFQDLLKKIRKISE